MENWNYKRGLMEPYIYIYAQLNQDMSNGKPRSLPSIDGQQQIVKP